MVHFVHDHAEAVIPVQPENTTIHNIQLQEITRPNTSFIILRWDPQSEEIMRGIEFDSGAITRERPLDIRAHTSKHGELVFSLKQTNNGEVARSQLNALFRIDEVENRAWDLNQRLLSRRREAYRVRVVDVMRVREEVLDQVRHVDGRIKRASGGGTRRHWWCGWCWKRVRVWVQIWIITH